MASTCARCGKDLGKEYPGNVYCCRQKDKPPRVESTSSQSDHWRLLHNQALALASWNPKTIADWYSEWERKIPNINCECRKHWKELIERNPPDFGSPLAFFCWGVARHNDVNKRLSKPEITIEEACRLYGWP